MSGPQIEGGALPDIDPVRPPGFLAVLDLANIATMATEEDGRPLLALIDGDTRIELRVGDDLLRAILGAERVAAAAHLLAQVLRRPDNR